jgi:hypothetical protein
MAITQNTFNGDGSNLGPFSFTFKWLEPTDIKVTVSGVLKTAGTHYNLQSLNYATKSGGQVLFTAGNAPAVGTGNIVVYRQTDDSDLSATFNSGSAIRAQDLNDNFTQGLYVTQEANNNVITANATANAATATANTALSNSTAAVSTANTASSNASAAVATANTASSNASAAVSTANTASSNATTAVNTANAATATANSAASDAATAISTANSAVSTANTASTNATNAVNTANAASSAASSAVSTANTASSNASAAVSTANTASSNATSAVNTANSALSTANAAASAVANAILYDIVANVAAIPGSPANNDAVEVTDSTGIESFTPLTGVPGGFVGNSGLSVRIVYTTTGNTWTWIQYFPNDPETRYLKLGGGTLTGSLGVTTGSAASPSVFVTGDTNTGIYSPGADQLALSTNGTGRLFVNSSGYTSVGNSSPQALVHFGAGTSAPAFGTPSNLVYVCTAGQTEVQLRTTVNDVTGSIYTDSSGVNIRAASAHPLSFLTSNTERLRITSAGLVGVGTSTPHVNLHVHSTSDNAALEITRGAVGSEYGYALYGSAGPTDAALRFFTVENGIGTGEKMRLDSLGRLGIGTSSPRLRTHIVGAAANAPTLGVASGSLIVGPNDNDYGMMFGVSGSGWGWIQSQNFVTPGGAAYDLALQPSGGRLLIGTSSARDNFYNTTGEAPQAQIEGTTYNGSSLSLTLNQAGTQAPRLLFGKTRGTSVGSNTVVQSGDQVGVLVFLGSDGTNLVDAARISCEVDGTPGADDMPGRLVFSTTADGTFTPTERMRIQSDGVVKIAGDTWTLSRTYIGTSGSFNSSIGTSSAGTGSTTLYIGNAAIQVSSDARLKENIEDTSLNALDAISQIKVKDFTWNDPTDTSFNNRNARGKWTGLIAQELVEVLPFVVNAPRKEEDGSIDYDSENLWTLDQSQLCPVLIKAVQQQQEIISSLKARIAALESA